VKKMEVTEIYYDEDKGEWVIIEIEE